MSKLILFDVDHTLVDVGIAHAQVFASGFEKFFDLHIDPKHFLKHGYTDLQIIHEVLAEHNKEANAQTVAELISYMMDEFSKSNLNEAMLFDGVVPLLERLKQKGYIIGLVTGNIRQIAYTKLKHFGIDQHFLLGGFGESSTIRSELIHSALEQAKSKGYSIDNNDVFIIGDTPKDITAAKEAQVKCIAVAQGKYSEEELAKHNADKVVKSLDDIEQIMDVIDHG